MYQPWERHHAAREVPWRGYALTNDGVLGAHIQKMVLQDTNDPLYFQRMKSQIWSVQSVLKHARRYREFRPMCILKNEVARCRCVEHNLRHKQLEIPLNILNSTRLKKLRLSGTAICNVSSSPPLESSLRHS